MDSACADTVSVDPSAVLGMTISNFELRMENWGGFEFLVLSFELHENRGFF
jgi:hypothetical protein